VVEKVVVNIVVNIAAEAALEELGRLGKLVVIELDKGESKSYNKDVYSAFKEVIKVGDYKASYLEAL
jgi:hypothetical protein